MLGAAFGKTCSQSDAPIVRASEGAFVVWDASKVPGTCTPTDTVDMTYVSLPTLVKKCRAPVLPPKYQTHARRIGT